VQLYRAVRVVAGSLGAQRSSTLEAPFVGRDRELRMIKELLHASGEERKAQLVSVTGIAGIGKTRLSWEFEKYVDGLAETTLWHRGRCLSYGEGVAYWALVDMVKMRCRIAEEEGADAFGKLHSTIEAFVSDPEEQRWIEPRLAHLLGLDGATEGDQENIFSAWRLFFERLAERYPVIMVFEDMQWADDGLLDFIEHLLEWSRNHPIFILALARPELADRRPTWGPASAATHPLTSNRSPKRRWKNWSPASYRASGETRGQGSWSAPKASRSMPSRPFGCSSTEGSSYGKEACTGRPVRSSRSRYRTPSTR
jgi:hypothetical protein